MIREQIAEAVKAADQEVDRRRACMSRLIGAALKDRDASAREAGRDRLSDAEIAELLTKMIEQRVECAESYELDGRLDLAEAEREEIEIISTFLPQKLDSDAVRNACAVVVQDVEGRGLRDMGRCMSELKVRYPGQIDSSEASKQIKEILTSGRI